MGILPSCCGRRCKQTSEREPLLPTHSDQQSLPQKAIPSQITFNKLAAFLAALQNGKLPTQQQLNDLTNLLLTSPLFRDIQTPTDGVLSKRGRLVLQDLADVLRAFSELGIVKNDGNYLQSAVYELRQLSDHPLSVEPRVETFGSSALRAAAAELPFESIPPTATAQDDAQRFYDSIKTLVILLFTSSAFRLLLTDVFTTSREILADLTAQVGNVAEAVESGAQVLEGIVRPSEEERQLASKENGKHNRTPVPDIGQVQRNQAEIKVEAEKMILETVDESTARGQAAWESLQEQSPGRIRTTILERIKTIIRRAHEDPRFESALQTIVTLAENYFRLTWQTALSVSNAAQAGLSSVVSDISVDGDVAIDVDPHLQRALLAAKTLLERFVGGRIDTTVHDLSVIFQDMQSSTPDTDSPNILQRAREYVQKALDDLSWMGSLEADTQLESIYSDMKEYLNGQAPQEKKLKHEMADFLEGVQAMVDTVKQDDTVQNCFRAVTVLGLDTAYFTSISKPDVFSVVSREVAVTANRIRRELQHDILAFVVPRLLHALRVIPLPRIEFKSPTIDAVLENLNISSFSFMPDHLSVTNWSELNVVGSDGARARGSYGSTITSAGTPTVTISDVLTRTRVRIEGLRISADDIAYYVDARGPLWLGWRDHGLLALDVGSKGTSGEGISVDVEVELAGEDFGVPDPSSAFFRVVDVKVDVPGLAFTIKKSRHWIFNSLLLQPLLGPTIRRALSILFAQRIRSALEKVDASLGEATRKCATNNPSGWLDWTTTIISSAVGSHPPLPEDDTQDSESDISEYLLESPPPPVASTSVTTKGIVHVSHQPATMPEDDTVVAIGIGEQVLHDIPLPSPGDPKSALTGIQRSALDDLQEGVDRVEHQVHQVAETAREARKQVEEEILVAGDKWKERSRVEKRKEGWRSAAFDVGR